MPGALVDPANTGVLNAVIAIVPIVIAAFRIVFFMMTYLLVAAFTAWTKSRMFVLFWLKKTSSNAESHVQCGFELLSRG